MALYRDMESFLRRLLVDSYDVPDKDFSADLSLKEYLDSLERVELFIAMEDEFDVYLDYSSVDKIDAVKELLDMVLNLKNKVNG